MSPVTAGLTVKAARMATRCARTITLPERTLALRWMPPARSRGALVITVVFAAFYCLFPMPALATPSATCPVRMSPYDLSPEALNACGDHLLPRKSTTPLPGGGYQANYVESNGTETSVTVPPPSFDAATASPAELRLYGIPTEPAVDSPEYPKWKHMIDGPMNWAPAPEALVEVPPVTRRATEATAPVLGEKATEPPSSATTGGDSKWSGYMDWNGGGCSGICSPIYTHSTGYFIEPASNNTTSGCTEVASYTWAGIGGWHSNESTLAQDGTGQQAPNLGPDEAFYEVIHPNEGGGGTIATKFHASPGHYFIADTEYTGSNKYSFYMYNYETHQPFRTTATGALWGKTTEFIIERPREHNLYNFKSVTFQGFTNGKAFRQYPNERIDMQSGDFVKEQGFLNAAAPTNIINNYQFNDVFHICTKATEKTVEEELEGAGKGGKLPHAVTEGSSEQTGTTVKLSGSVGPEGTYTTYHFEYGTEAENYSAATPENSAGEGSTSVPVSATVMGLQPGTTYHYRITANSAEGTAVGTDKTFTTAGTPPPPPPSVTTEATSGVTTHTATLEATVNPNGLDTHYYFEYGTNPTLFEADAPALPGNDAGSGTSPVHEKVEVTGLEQHTTYYYRVVASNATGTSYSTEKAVKTPGWLILTTPKAPGEHTRNDQLVAVSCASGTTCEGVGSFLNEEFVRAPLSESWNASSWAVQTAQAPKGALGTYPEAVSCSSSTTCTATGHWLDEKGESHLFAEGLSGSSWSLQSPATPETSSATLSGVSCPASNECYTAGWYVKISPREDLPLVERWNGSTWKILTTATLPAEDKEGAYSGISCPAIEHCVAVGTYYSKTQGIQPLVENLNGTKWTWQTLPGGGLISAELAGVSCTSTSACTAVGHNHEHTKEALIARWNGTSWTLQSSPSPTGKPAEIEAGWALTQVSCATATVCVTTGWYKATSSEARQLLGEVWNGTAWSLMPPVPRAGAATNEITGLSCPTEQKCFATGYTENSGKTETESLAEELEGA
jgi:hypothetical protein